MTGMGHQHLHPTNAMVVSWCRHALYVSSVEWLVVLTLVILNLLGRSRHGHLGNLLHASNESRARTFLRWGFRALWFMDWPRWEARIGASMARLSRCAGTRAASNFDFLTGPPSIIGAVRRAFEAAASRGASPNQYIFLIDSHGRIRWRLLDGLLPTPSDDGAAIAEF